MKSIDREIDGSESLCVSIITVVYNAKETIRRTIESVVSQSHHNIDYIIVDGGSIDGTLDIINEYNNHFSSFVSEKDKGIYDAMNKGLSLAKGDVIGILNSDDYLYVDAIEKVVKSFKDSPNIDFVYAKIDILDSAGNKVMTFQPLRHEEMLTKGITEMGAQHSSIYARKEAYETLGGFDQNYKIVADHDFLIRLFSRGYKGHEIDDTLGAVSLGGESDDWKMNKELYVLAKSYGLNPIEAFLISLRRLLGRKAAGMLGHYFPGILAKLRSIKKSRYEITEK